MVSKLWIVYVKMSQSHTPSSCSGCYPVYQPNQLAHMDPGGCLWCSYAEENEQLRIEGELENLFDEPLILENASDTHSSNNTECCICYETIDKSKNNCTTECGHNFCLKCLMTSFAHDNNACPCCRQELIDLPSEDDDDGDDEDDGDGDEDDEENEDTDDEEDYDPDTPECPVEEIARRLEINGYTMESVLSMLLGRYRKGEQDLNIFELNKKFDVILEEADAEALEQDAMGKEDTRAMVAV